MEIDDLPNCVQACSIVVSRSSDTEFYTGASPAAAWTVAGQKKVSSSIVVAKDEGQTVKSRERFPHCPRTMRVTVTGG